MAKEVPTRIYGVIGFPVKHSLSPVMHNFAFETLFNDGILDFKGEYRQFEKKPEELEDFLSLDSLKKENIWGLNVTIPYKVRAKEILDKKFQLETEYYVKLSGVINTIKRDGDILSYYNTDATGFIDSLGKDLKFDTKNKKVLIIGCGGAGRAIIASLTWKNVDTQKIYVNDISDKAILSAKEHFSQLPQWPYLKEILQFISTKDIPKYIEDCHLLINASPVGMKNSDPLVIDKKVFRKDLYVYDVIYNRETPLIKEAKKICGAEKVMDGGRMLYRQGEVSFELWTGEKFPVGTWEELKKELDKCQKR